MDNKFFHQVRIPRRILNADSPQKRELITRWAERICRDVGREWKKPINISFPQRNQTKIFISGEERNTVLAAQLVRKAVIEVDNDSFDTFETLDFMEKQIKFVKTEEEEVKKAAIENSCRVDFKIAVENMTRKQTDSFDRLQVVFSRMGVEISSVENKPTFIQLSCDQPDILKCARLTAEWAATEIASAAKITRNGIQSRVKSQSVKILGIDKASEFHEMVFN